MKKTLHIRDKNLIKVIKLRLKRKYISKEKRKCKKSGRKFRDKTQTSRIDVPMVVTIEATNNRKTFLRFMSEFRRECLQKRNNVVLNFRNTELITPAGMLLLVAEVYRAKLIFNEKISIKIADVTSTIVKQVLVQIGFYELCGMIPPRLDQHEFEDTVKHWKFATAERADEQTSGAFAEIEGLISRQLRGGMWRGISEAIINSVQHAYVAPRGVPGPRMKHNRWWMFTQEKEGELTVAVCDLGIGIPRSLPLNWDQSVLSRVMSPFSDGGPDLAALKAALELGKSRTGAQHRGKGLPQIWNAVKGDARARILIHSNRAKLAWNGQENRESGKQFSDSIFGTVVMWTVPVNDDVGPESESEVQ